jgi:hypothetical protein
MSDMDLENKLAVAISSYSVNNSDTYAAIWVERPGPWPGGSMEVFQAIDAPDYQRTFDSLTSSGSRPIRPARIPISTRVRIDTRCRLDIVSRGVVMH